MKIVLQFMICCGNPVVLGLYVDRQRQTDIDKQKEWLIDRHRQKYVQINGYRQKDIDKNIQGRQTDKNIYKEKDRWKETETDKQKKESAKNPKATETLP